MQNVQVTAFIELVELDQRLVRLSLEKDEQEARKCQLEQELAQIDQDVDLADRAVLTAQKKIHEVELELQIIERNLTRTREKQERASSQKELDSLEHEREDLERHRREREDQGLELLEAFEEARKRAAAIHEQAPQLRLEKKKALDDLVGQMDRLIISGKNCDARREDLKVQVADDLLKSYESMKARIANPVVPVIKESCSGCFYPLNLSEVQAVQRGQLVTCKSCYRTLYITHPNTDNKHEC